MFQLRPYQQAACDATLAWVKSSIDPVLIDAAPAAGKSYMIAHLAGELHRMSGGKRVLVLAPNNKLVKQNSEKYRETGEQCSIFSASAGQKSTRHVVVFGTPLTVRNAISRFTKEGKDGFCAVIIDESHELTPTIIGIIEAMREANPNLRVIGLTGTPFTIKGGYIFRQWPDCAPFNSRVNGDDVTRDPYFMKCAYRVSAREMLDEGFITPMVIGAINASAYDTSGVTLLPNGSVNPESAERAFVGHGRETAQIVHDVINQARDRPGGIMYFAQTQKHAMEILASLPVESSALSTGDNAILFGNEVKEDAVVKAYRAQKIRHLVSIGKFTTGFDVSHTETIALLRYTESASLLQQILGRAWRLHDGKDTCLLLDYAGNVERHFPDGDIYNPKIKAGSAGGTGEPIPAICPDCGYQNEFTLNQDYKDYQRDEAGYCLDVFGEPIVTDFGPLSAHYGRRCMGMVRTGDKGEYERCGYRWSGKDCLACGEKNDIAARHCYVCKAEIVDPGKKLIVEFKAHKKDPTQPQTDEVLSMEVRDGVSGKGNRTVRADFVTPYRQFSVWMLPDSENRKHKREWESFHAATYLGKVKPDTISYVKDADSGFYRILAYNQEADEEPEGANMKKRRVGVS